VKVAVARASEVDMTTDQYVPRGKLGSRYHVENEGTR